MKKTWTKEEFIEACRDHMNSKMPYYLERQEARRQRLRMKARKRNAKSKRKHS